jgi:acyl-CoA thioesterase FadM
MEPKDGIGSHPDVPREAGIAVTYCGSVQTWECDRNNHWNVRFYIRAFQMASETFALYVCGRNPGAETAVTRHIRFHRELFPAQTMTVRSARAPRGKHGAAVVHLMESQGKLCATALDLPGFDTSAGAEWNEEDIVLALPRGLDGAPHIPDGPAELSNPNLVRQSQVSVVRPIEIDHAGHLMMNELFGFCTASSHNLLTQLGFSSDWMNATGKGRMAVEMKVTRHGPCKAGDALRTSSWISGMAEKTFSVRHRLETHEGSVVATVEQFLVAVDLNTRRAIPLPDFFKESFQR